MEKTKDKQRKKGKNKVKENFIQPAEEVSITFGSWNKRISTLRRQNEAAMSAQVNPPETAKHQQSVKAPTRQGVSKKGQAGKGDLNCTQSETVPKFCILQRQPEDAPQQAAAPEDVPQQAATPTGAPQKAAAPEGAPQQTELTRGPVQRKKLWTPPPPYRTPLREHSVEVKDTAFKRGPVQQKKLWTPPPPYHTRVKTTDFKRGPVQQKKLWTPPPPYRTQVKANNFKRGPVQQLCTAPRHHTPQCAPAKPQQADRVKACDGVEAFPQHATIHVPELEPQQLRSRETEQTTELERANEALAALLEQLQETPAKACDGVEASPQEARIYVSELELQQLRNRKTEQTTKLKKENGALAAEMEQLKETLQRNNALHDDIMLKRVNKIMDLELQLLATKTTEAEALQKLQQMEKHLQRQKESRKELDVCLAQQTEENNRLTAALTLTQRELESQQLQWQEERSRLLQSLSDIHHTLQEEEKAQKTRWDGMTDKIVDLEQQMKKIDKKPKRPSLRRRFLQLFK
ncbi:uncharacterized protein LOC122884824 [Siniperca chuatsi]|uniref:uncharacterized protein LOC122884824 n=1 Tax=Siniperca chuatsi TaxID=119488 RepID=UPI001CE1A028|nr:uncharacterized protein LOC122884824 [Siniperca chuatsi]